MRTKKIKSALDQAHDKFSNEHYITMSTDPGCMYGDHVDIQCACGWAVETYGTPTDIVYHVLETIYKEKE